MKEKLIIRKKIEFLTGQAPTPRKVWGQATLEILVAIAVLAISITAVIAVIFGGQSLSIDISESDRAISLARQNLEAAKVAALSNFNGLANSSTTQGEFLKEIIVSSVDSNTKQILSRVSWATDPLRTQKIELLTLVTNWQNYQATGGHTGGTGLICDWKNPQTLGSINLGPGESAYDLKVMNKIVYIAASASDASKPDLFIVNAVNGSSPYIVSSLNTGPGLNAIAIAGHYAYLANSDKNNQLQIVDVSNLSSPVLIASYKLPNVSGNGAIGNSIYYYGGKIYIGTLQATGPEFHVIDVSNPLSPVEVGSFDVGFDVNGIFVNNGIAYLANSDDGQELKILNVANPSNITQIGSYNAPGGEDGKSVYLVGTTLYMGRESGTSDFLILDVSNPASVRLLSAVNLGGVAVNGIYVRDYLAFLATTDSNFEFQTWNISSSTSPTLWSGYNFPNIATGNDYESNLVYTSVRSNDGLRIVTSGPCQ